MLKLPLPLQPRLICLTYFSCLLLMMVHWNLRVTAWFVTCLHHQIWAKNPTIQDPVPPPAPPAPEPDLPNPPLAELMGNEGDTDKPMHLHTPNVQLEPPLPRQSSRARCSPTNYKPSLQGQTYQASSHSVELFDNASLFFMKVTHAHATTQLT